MAAIEESEKKTDRQCYDELVEKVCNLKENIKKAEEQYYEP
tara:strand:+ start:692 stop:814 length:123 start_codon:yes stop_codon:yes gene_type:complete